MLDHIQTNYALTPAKSAQDQKKQAVAQDFVKNFFAQNVALMLQTVGDENYERDMYASFLAESIGEKIAASATAAPIVTRIYEHMLGPQHLQPINEEEKIDVLL